MTVAQSFVFHSTNRKYLDGHSPHITTFGFRSSVPYLLVWVAIFGTGFVIGMAFLCAFAAVWLEERSLTATARATVIDIQEARPGDDETSYRVAYRLAVPVSGNGRIYERQAWVGHRRSGAVRRLQPGHAVPVRYDPGDPSVSRLELESCAASSGAGLLKFAMFLAMAGGSATFLVWCVRQWRRVRRLARHGTVVRGKVSSCSAVDSTEDVAAVEYDFQAPGGRQVHAKEKGFCESCARLPSPGTAVQVLYLDAQTYAVL